MDLTHRFGFLCVLSLKMSKIHKDKYQTANKSVCVCSLKCVIPIKIKKKKRFSIRNNIQILFELLIIYERTFEVFWINFFERLHLSLVIWRSFSRELDWDHMNLIQTCFALFLLPFYVILSRIYVKLGFVRISQNHLNCFFYKTSFE